VNVKFWLVVLAALIVSKPARAQIEWCSTDGTPNGHGVICVNPWQPSQGQQFELNFASTSCTQQTNHEYQVIRDGQNLNIYLVYGVGGCPGVPQGPLIFQTIQTGLPPGNYQANLLRDTVASWPPPPFDPANYELRTSVPFSIQGTPTAAQPVPVTTRSLLLLLVAAFLMIGLSGLFRMAPDPRKTK
jgi:hypothetical protein